MIRNSIRQMLRTPLSSVLFLVFVTAASIFLSLGGTLWASNASQIRAYEESFITIGTVEQRPTSISQVSRWDAQRKDYVLHQRPEYHTYLPLSLLSFEGAGYTTEPEKRSYYGSYGPEYTLVSEESNFGEALIIAEVTPLEDCVPEESVQVNINKLLLGDPSLEGTAIWLCAHYRQDPEPLYKDKSYVMLLYLQLKAHGALFEEKSDADSLAREYIPVAPLSSHYDSNGMQMEDSLLEKGKGEILYYEVEEGFYKTEIGKRYMSLAESLGMRRHTFPVTGTNDTVLLMPFYKKDAFIMEGRDITEEEYQTGEKVCLISKHFAENNEISIGDDVQVRLYFTNSKGTPGEVFGREGGGGGNSTCIHTNGEPFQIFEESTYQVAGIYDLLPGADRGSYGLGGDEVIVPLRSIANRDRENIMSYGPMQGKNTSFRIPNGSVDSFMKAWGEQGAWDVEITFYDMGYSKLESGINNMKYMAFIFVLIGFIMTLALLFFSAICLSPDRKGALPLSGL